MISIIVPIYNMEKYLLKCLNSVRYQTFQKLEVILVDYGSTDQSGAICDRFVRVDQRFRVIHTDNRGPSSACNQGLKLAKGQFVSFLYPTDNLSRFVYELLFTIQKREKADCVISGYYDEVLAEVDTIGNFNERVTLSAEEALLLEVGQSYMNHYLGNKLFSIKLFKTEPVIRFDEKIYFLGDLLVCGQCYFKSQKIVCHPKPLYHFMPYHSSFQKTLSVEKKRTGLEAILKLLELVPDEQAQARTKIKEMYIKTNIDLLMKEYAQKEHSENHKEIMDVLESNLYRFNIQELKDRKVRRFCSMAQRNLRLTYVYWKADKKSRMWVDTGKKDEDT